jgi:hypothetical protein
METPIISSGLLLIHEQLLPYPFEEHNGRPLNLHIQVEAKPNVDVQQ